MNLFMSEYRCQVLLHKKSNSDHVLPMTSSCRSSSTPAKSSASTQHHELQTMQKHETTKPVKLGRCKNQ